MSNAYRNALTIRDEHEQQISYIETEAYRMARQREYMRLVVVELYRIREDQNSSVR